MQELQKTITGSGRSFGVGNGNPLQYSCLENSMENEAWQTAVHRVHRVRHGWAVDREHVPSTLTFWRVFIINECWILQKLILHQLRWFFFLFFSVLTWCVTLTDLCIWSWWSFYEFSLLVLFLSSFTSIFIMRLAWLCVCVSLSDLASGWWWPHSMKLGMLLLQFFRRVSEWWVLTLF